MKAANIIHKGFYITYNNGKFCISKYILAINFQLIEIDSHPETWQLNARNYINKNENDLLISFEIRIDQKFKIGANVNKMQSRLNL
jgi:hypothetical protein